MFESILFPVEKQDLEHNGKKTSFCKIVRTDKNELIGINSKDYLLIPNRMVLDAVLNKFHDKINLKDFNKKDMFSNGRQFTINLRMDFDKIEVQKDDFIACVITIENSYDGSKALRISVNGLRLICMNGMTSGHSIFSNSTKHLSIDKSPEDIIEEMIKSLDENALVSFKEMGGLFISMTETKIDKDIKNAFVKKVSLLPAYISELVIEQIIKDEPKTLWDLYNCVTYVMTHMVDRTKQSILEAEKQINQDIICFIK